MMAFYLYFMLAISVGALGVILLLVQRIERVNSILAGALTDLETAAYREAVLRVRESTTNRRVEEIFMSLSPLLEQTDWMTERWGGQFETLVRMERSRNSAAVDIRSKLFALPFMKDFFSENKAALFTSLPESVATGLENERKDK